LSPVKNTTCINQSIRENFNGNNISVIVDLSYLNEFLRDDLIEFWENNAIEIYKDRLFFSLLKW